MNPFGVLALVVVAIAVVAAWINYGVASPARRRRILATRETRSEAIAAKSAGSAWSAMSHDNIDRGRSGSSVSEDSAYGS